MFLKIRRSYHYQRVIHSKPTAASFPVDTNSRIHYNNSSMKSEIFFMKNWMKQIKKSAESGAEMRKIMAEKNPIVTITMENGDIMKAELYPEIAPNTVNNFIFLVSKGFYDNLIFHRVIEGFMLQGGDPEGTGMGGPDYSIPGEFAQNGFQNDLKHTRGVLSMARSQHPDSAGSQFFIMHKNAPHLDGAYAAFGKVIEGEDIIDRIAGVPTDWNDRPMETQRMKSVTVETFGVSYPQPKHA